MENINIANDTQASNVVRITQADVFADLQTQVDSFKAEQRFNPLPVIDRTPELRTGALLGGKDQRVISVWCASDGLGMSRHPVVTEAVIRAVQAGGAGAGYRTLSGTSSYHADLETEIASWQQKESALIFPSAYGANDATIAALGQRIPGLIIFIDELDHASIKAGVRMSGAKRQQFRHNDMQDLKRQLQRADPAAPKLIVFESLYSMDGDFAPVQEIVELAESVNAMTYIDESHAVGLFGATGAGYAEVLGVRDRITILHGSMSKAVGTIGGYIATSKVLTDLVRIYGLSFTYSAALPAPIVAGTLASVRYIRSHSEERKHLYELVQQMRRELAQAGIPVLEGTSGIVPVMVGDTHRARQLSHMMLEEHDMYVAAITPSIVPEGTARLRVTLSAQRTSEQVTAFVAALSQCWSALGLHRMGLKSAA